MPERSPVEEGDKKERRRIDLSVAQVAASALATVAGALLASELGVYGTILGAAVVSIGATTGGALFQHLFKRTGEQLREAVDRGPNQTLNTLRQVPADRPDAEAPPAVSSQWSEPRVVRARRRWTWKSYAAVSGLVFVLAMTPIVAYEVATGQPVSATVRGESGSGTSFGGTVAPKGREPQDAQPDRPAPSGGVSQPLTRPSAQSSTGPEPRPSGTPSATPSGGASPSVSPSPSATPSAGASPSAGGGRPTGSATPQPPVPSESAAASQAPVTP
ncbi:hypothetical protein [Streptomyces sp. NRRL WC-3742]|uniref:hypothetical protein n=1 Tax=Streptomyces sp. NRRL WC-3742 TaxID=1463934 RepID=UPI000690E372|nr:hypothetical protein [Streptomyces sp. NRRL WC-3742]